MTDPIRTALRLRDRANISHRLGNIIDWRLYSEAIAALEQVMRERDNNWKHYDDARRMREHLRTRAEAAERERDEWRAACLGLSPPPYAAEARAEAAEHVVKEAQDELLQRVKQLNAAERERDALRAKVERLSALLKDCVDELENNTGDVRPVLAARAELRRK